MSTIIDLKRCYTRPHHYGLSGSLRLLSRRVAMGLHKMPH